MHNYTQTVAAALEGSRPEMFTPTAAEQMGIAHEDDHPLANHDRGEMKTTHSSRFRTLKMLADRVAEEGDSA